MAGRLRSATSGSGDAGRPRLTEDPYSDDNWVFQYHSLHWADPLRRVGLATDNQAMLDRYEAIIRDWVQDNPVDAPPSRSPGTTWRTGSGRSRWSLAATLSGGAARLPTRSTPTRRCCPTQPATPAPTTTVSTRTSGSWRSAAPATSRPGATSPCSGPPPCSSCRSTTGRRQRGLGGVPDQQLPLVPPARPRLQRCDLPRIPAWPAST